MKRMPDRAELVNNLAVLRGLIEYKQHLPHGTASCYLRGPISGIPGANRHAFEVCASILREAGWDVYNPFQAQDGSYGLEEADCLCLLPGWEIAGGRSEVWRAHERGMPVFTYLNQRSFGDVISPTSGSAPEASHSEERAEGEAGGAASASPALSEQDD